MKKIYFTGISILTLIVSFGVFSCTTHKKTTASSSTSSSTSTSTSTSTAAITYSASAKNIIDANCSRCHGYGRKIDMTAYASVKKFVDDGSFKKEVIVDRSMPRGRSLSEQDYNTIKAWLEAGAPE